MLPKESILGINITNASEDTILEYIFASIEAEKMIQIVTPNPEMVVYAQKDAQFKSILNGAAIALPDGVGLVLGLKLLGKKVTQRITGIDFMEKLCRESVSHNFRIGLLGGRNGVAEKTAEVLKKKYPGIDIVFVGEEWSELISSIDILYVAFGHPKQEEWIYKNLPKIDVHVAMGVGGAFDYVSGNVPRAPKIIRNYGLEWLYRLLVQPWRWRRQVALLEFIYLVVKEKVKR